MENYILVHGAWHAAWCWEEVATLLSQAGHQVMVPDLPGHGSDPKVHTAVKFQDYINCIMSLVEACDEVPILVGHSFAGMFLSQIAAAYPEKIKKFIYLTAYVPLSGESFLRISENLSEAPLSDELIVDKSKASIFIKTENVHNILYNCTTPEKQAIALKNLSPEPLMPFATPVNLNNLDYSTIDTHYIFCTQDRALKLEDQQWMSKRTQGKFSSLDADHSPFLSRPKELARQIGWIRSQ